MGLLSSITYHSLPHSFTNLHLITKILRTLLQTLPLIRLSSTAHFPLATHLHQPFSSLTHPLYTHLFIFPPSLLLSLSLLPSSVSWKTFTRFVWFNVLCGLYYYALRILLITYLRKKCFSSHITIPKV